QARRAGRREGDGRPVGGSGRRCTDAKEGARLRGQPQHAHARAANHIDMRQQVLYGCGWRLYAVQREKRLVLARVESDAVRVAAADELTVVLRSTMRPRGEAARREGEGQPTIG